MFAGIKFLPRDQVDASPTQHSSDSGSSLKERKKSKSHDKRYEKKRRKKPCPSVDVDCQYGKESLKGKGRRMGKNNKREDLHNYGGSDILSQSTSENHSDSEDEKSRRKKRSRMKRNYNSSDEDSSSLGEDDSQHHRRKHIKHKEDIGDLSHSDKEAMRKEMGLDWMSKAKDSVEKRVQLPDLVQEEPSTVEVIQNPRELNPYLKDNGSGFPDDASNGTRSSSALPSSSVVGDGGASWRLKALKRAQEQAAREGRKLNDVVEERWGSLGQLAASVASHRAAHGHAHLHAIKDRRRGTAEMSETIEGGKMKGETGEAHIGHQAYLKDVHSRHPEMRKPKQDSYAWRKTKHGNFPRDNPVISDALSKLNKFSNDGSYMDKMTRQQSKHVGKAYSSQVDGEVNDLQEEDTIPSKTVQRSKEHLDVMQGLSANQLGAKALQLRLKGKHEEAESLLKEAESTTDNKVSEANAINPNKDGKPSRGGVPIKLKKREDDADLNLAQRIIRNRQYSISGQADEEYDFNEAPARKRNMRRESETDERHTMAKRILTQQERCQFCFENPARQKHLVVSIANFTYMMLPQWQPVVQGHCCILPLQHEVSTRTVDDNVWEEMRNFKKCLIMMFDREDKDMIFLETVIGLSKQRRHCLIECVPLPRQLAKEAPLYFKKAIDEAAHEWSQHHAKRLLETTAEKGLRRSIPKDFPYFYVEFGLDKGFVHVIDDEAAFESSLGLNVIRGMLRLPEEDMYRRRRPEPVEKQRSAVASFAREWEPFDWTKQLLRQC